MSDKELEQTQKALEELIKVEYMAITAYDTALDETDDNKLRRQYSRFRNDHEKQARDLNNRLADLGGTPVDYEETSGKTKAGLWAKITGLFGDAASLGGMVKGAEDGIRIYLDHLDEIHDSKALSIIRRNLEAKQHEVRWLEEQSQNDQGGNKTDLGDKARKVAEDVSKKQGKAVEVVQAKVEDAAKPRRTGFLSLPVWLLLAALAGAAFVFLRRQEEPDFSDEAFQYETTDFGTAEGGDAPATGGEGYHGISEGSNSSAESNV